MSEESLTWGVWKDGFGFMQDGNGDRAAFTLLGAQARAAELQAKDSTASYKPRLLSDVAKSLK